MNYNSNTNLNFNPNSNNNSSLNLPKRVCIKQKNLLQLGYSNLEEWLKNPNNLYVGRRGRIFIGSGTEKRVFFYPQSKWGNPYKIKDHPNITIDNLILLYKQHLITSGLINQIDELLNKNIGCFCDLKDRCHTDVLISNLSEKYPQLNRNDSDSIFHFV